VKCEAEDPTWNLCTLRSFLILKPGEVYKIVGNQGVFIGGGVITVPLEGPTFPGLSEPIMSGTHDVVTTEIDPGWEDLGVALA